MAHSLHDALEHTDLVSAHRDEQGQPVVYSVQGDTARAVPVRLGIETRDRVEIVSGAQPGETVILTGGYGLAKQAKVRVKP